MFHQKKKVIELEKEIEALKARIRAVERGQTAHTYEYGDITLKTLAQICKDQKKDIHKLAEIFEDIQQAIGNSKSLAEGVSRRK